MAINNFPTSLQPAIQAGFLDQQFEAPLLSKRAYRHAGTKEMFMNNVGETITKTRAGLKAPRTTQISGASNTNLDNGLSPSAYAVEQYTLTLGMYGDTIDLNVITQKVGIADQFVQNAYRNGVQAASTLERLARNALVAGANAGNTYSRTTSTTTSISVDDITGFTTVYVNGVPTPVSVTNPLTITMGPNNTTYTVTSVVADGSNVSKAFNGISGVLTTTVAAATGDAAITSNVGTSVKAATATNAFYPNAKVNWSALTSTDTLTMSTIESAVAQLRNNAIPPLENGTYGLVVDNTSMRELYADPDFKQLYQGNSANGEVFENGIVSRLVGVTLFTTTEAPIFTNAAGVTIHQPILFGQDALIEAQFANMSDIEGITSDDEVSVIDGVVMVTRSPLDRLRQIVAQSWYSVIAYVVPTDVTTNSTIVPTSSNAAVKRVIPIYHA